MNREDLYGLDPAQFVAARNQLAKELRAGGDKDGAAAVAKLRRPTATAWALNQLARQRPELVDAALAAGARLRAATERALEGDASDLRAAQTDERAAVEAAIAAASGYLDRAGHASPDRGRQLIAGTLRAAGADADVAELLQAGTLDVDREAPGLGLDRLSPSSVVRGRPQPSTRSAAPPPTPPTRPAAPKPTTRLEEKREEAEQRRRARARHTQLAAEADRLEREARHLRAQADAAEKRAATARAAADAARVPEPQRGSRPGG